MKSCERLAAPSLRTCAAAPLAGVSQRKLEPGKVYGAEEVDDEVRQRNGLLGPCPHLSLPLERSQAP